MMQNNFVVVTPQELQSLIYSAVSQAVSQIRLPQKTEPPLPEYLSIEQASLYLNLAKQTLYGHVSNRKIPFIKQGGKLLFQKSKLVEWLKTGEKLTKKEYKTTLNIRKK